MFPEALASALIDAGVIAGLARQDCERTARSALEAARKRPPNQEPEARREHRGLKRA